MKPQEFDHGLHLGAHPVESHRGGSLGQAAIGDEKSPDAGGIDELDGGHVFKLLYGPRYAAAGDIARWLAISVWANIVLSSMERVPLALGHARALFLSNVVATLGYAVAVAGYHAMGLPGLIMGVTSGLVAAHLVLLVWVPVQRGRMARQTVVYTAIFGAYGGLGGRCAATRNRYPWRSVSR